MIKQKHPLENTVAKDTFVLVAAALPGRMRPAKGAAQVSCRLQFFELDHFRASIKDQCLPKSRWQPTQTRQERLARGDGRLVLGLGRQQKAALVLLATEQGRLASRNADQIRSPVPKAGSARNGLWPPGLFSIGPGNRPLPRPELLCRWRGRWARGANDANWYRRAVRPRQSSGGSSPTAAMV